MDSGDPPRQAQGLLPRREIATGRADYAAQKMIEFSGVQLCTSKHGTSIIRMGGGRVSMRMN
jgi:hypothetical protein